MGEYKVGIYISDMEDEKKISGFLTDKAVTQLENMDEIYTCDERAVFITFKVYQKLSIKHNRDIPAKVPVMDDYELPNAIIVVIDADENDALANGCISGITYKVIRDNLAYALHYIGVSKKMTERTLQDANNPKLNRTEYDNGDRFGAQITNYVMEDFYDRDLPVAERYHNLCIIACCEELTEEDLINIRLLKEEMWQVFMEEYICLLGYQGFVAEDESVFDNIRDALKYAETQSWEDDHYIVEKVEFDSEETTYRFWYNKKLQLVGYAIVEKESFICTS